MSDDASKPELGRKSKRPPVWEVEEHTQQKLGALPNEYYKSRAERCAHEFHTDIIVSEKSNLEVFDQELVKPHLIDVSEMMPGN